MEMKREDSMFVSSKEEVKRVWKKHFECVIKKRRRVSMRKSFWREKRRSISC